MYVTLDFLLELCDYERRNEDISNLVKIYLVCASVCQLRELIMHMILFVQL